MQGYNGCTASQMMTALRETGYKTGYKTGRNDHDPVLARVPGHNGVLMFSESSARSMITDATGTEAAAATW
jgi:hypothetical protein